MDRDMNNIHSLGTALVVVMGKVCGYIQGALDGLYTLNFALLNTGMKANKKQWFAVSCIGRFHDF